MLLLAIETSSARGSLALYDGRREIDRALFPEGLVHGREITVHLRDLMARRGLPPGRIEAIAVGIGPGSYTGIRVGVTAAKTLALALKVPVLGESSLRILAANALAGEPGAGSGPEVLVAAAIDGKQRHLYLALFRVRHPAEGGEGEVERLVDDGVVELPKGEAPLSGSVRTALERVLVPGALVVGDGAEAALAASPGGARRGPAGWDLPLATELGRLAARTLAAGPRRFDPESVHRLVPLYLRVSEAERKYPTGLVFPRPPGGGGGR